MRKLLPIRRSYWTLQPCRCGCSNLSITLHSIGDGVITTDQNGLVVRMNATSETLCGWAAADAIGKPLCEVFRILHAETRQIVADPVKKVLESGEIIGLASHSVLISKNGNEYQITDSAAPIKNRQGEITGVVLVFSDATERYAAQKLVSESEQKFLTYTQFSPVAIYVTNTDGDCIYANNKWLELTGLSLEEALGNGWSKALHPDDVDIIRENWYKSVLENGKWTYEYRFINKHRSRAIVSRSKSPSSHRSRAIISRGKTLAPARLYRVVNPSSRAIVSRGKSQ